MPLQLDDADCLLWIIDPSISPFVNNKNNRRNILSEEALKNPRSLLNKIKRRCFFNSSLRQKIVDQIKEYQRDGTLRLYTLNDKISGNLEYINKPFSIDECRQWLSNHFVNPRTNEKINIGSHIFIELIYTAIQYGLPTPSISYTPPISKFEELAYNRMNKIIKDVKFRYEFMKENDELFLTHDIESFDREQQVATSASAASAAAKAKNSFDVSSSSTSYKSLNMSQKIRLRDKKLENKEEEKLVAEHLYKKGFVIKQKKDKKVDKEEDKEVFDNFRAFLIDLQDEGLNKNELINYILEDVEDHYKTSILESIKKFITPPPPHFLPQSFLVKHNFDTIEGVIRKFINNICAQLIDPAFVFDRYIEISVLSYNNLYETFRNNELIDNVIGELKVFVDRYSSVLDDKVIKYFKNIVEDRIPGNLISKVYINGLTMISYNTAISDYQNYYYTFLCKFNIKEVKHREIRLPEGMGLLIGKPLTDAFSNERYFNSNPDHRVITEDNRLNLFTYEECKNWVMIPIINPRTFEPILIDTPIYNTLLVISYQYDTNLIPRMLTSRGCKILIALRDAIHKILEEKEQPPQSREQLENYLIKKKIITDEQFKRANELRELASKYTQIPNIAGLKWKNVGTKKPTTGIEIIDKKLKAAFLKLTDKDGKPPFYVLFSEEEFAKFGITDITKDSYIEIATYYIPAIHTRRGATNNVGLKWKRINDERYKEGIKRKGIEIINKKLSKAFSKSTGQDSRLPGKVLFSKKDFENFGISAVAKNGYVKFAYYYKPVVAKSVSSVSNSRIESPKINIIRTADYIAKNRYNIINCLKWVMQPNKNPITNELIYTDSPEYNEIFEQALIFDNHIEPIDITPKGIKFKNKLLKIQKTFIGISKFKKKTPYDVSSAERYEILTKSEICDSINNIHVDDDNDTKYSYFKNKMLKMCDKYLGEKRVCNLANIKKKINDKFIKGKRNVVTAFSYFEGSALCSVIADYDMRNKKLKLYDNDVQNKFINHYKRIFKVFIYEIVEKDGELHSIKKIPVDAGGVSREFFTKLFEELFCDEENKKRPFILPEKNNGSNRYYINPNFEPDENFKTVIKYLNKDMQVIGDYNTEKEYEQIYYIIGKFLGIALVNEEIGIPKQFSTYILSRFINPPKTINYYDILYYYLKDFSNSRPYMNMMNEKQKNNIDYCDFNFNDYYIISKSLKSNPEGHPITKENYIKYILQLSKHIVTKNFLLNGIEGSDKNMKRRYESLFSGFNSELSAILYNNNVSIDMLDKLITNEQLDPVILIEFAEKLKISVIKFVGRSDIYNPNTGATKTEAEKQAIIDELKIYLTNIITIKREGTTDEQHYSFIKKLLQFWSGFSHYNKLAEVEENGYKFFYLYGGDVRMFPMAHTCSYQLDFFGFPEDKTTAEEKETYLYEKLKFAVFSARGMDIA